MVKTARMKTAEFKLHAPGAKRVSVAGTFNEWNAKSLTAKKDTKGNWKVKVNLKPGRYEYKFIVDGSWINDPSCNQCVYNSMGSQNCVIEIK